MNLISIYECAGISRPDVFNVQSWTKQRDNFLGFSIAPFQYN